MAKEYVIIKRTPIDVPHSVMPEYNTEIIYPDGEDEIKEIVEEVAENITSGNVEEELLDRLEIIEVAQNANPNWFLKED